MVLIGLVWVACSLIAMAVASGKGRSGCGWGILGLLLGPLGLLGAALASPDRAHGEATGLQSGSLKRCPYCAETIRIEAIKCRYCGADLPAAPAPPSAARSSDLFKLLFWGDRRKP